ncbi:Lrp/AsnC family transcriptional regulator [Candidatus Pacearchaeota archaeon]|nr:Lrp/AsnC family transcriptional regulator [Candidatus Pacearchaeota archaeon]
MAISSVGKQETIKLDLYDKKILWELALNSRIPRKQLAKKIGISQERLHYKINRLTKDVIEPAIILTKKKSPSF